MCKENEKDLMPRLENGELAELIPNASSILRRFLTDEEIEEIQNDPRINMWDAMSSKHGLSDDEIEYIKGCIDTIEKFDDIKKFTDNIPEIYRLSIEEHKSFDEIIDILGIDNIDAEKIINEALESIQKRYEEQRLKGRDETLNNFIESYTKRNDELILRDRKPMSKTTGIFIGDCAHKLKDEFMFDKLIVTDSKKEYHATYELQEPNKPEEHGGVIPDPKSYYLPGHGIGLDDIQKLRESVYLSKDTSLMSDLGVYCTHIDPYDHNKLANTNGVCYICNKRLTYMDMIKYKLKMDKPLTDEENDLLNNFIEKNDREELNKPISE